MNNKLSNIRKISLVTAIALVGLFLSFAYINPIQTASVRAQWTYPDGYDPHGVYIDKLTYIVYPAADEQLGLQALQAGLIYAWDERVPADNIAELEATAGVSVETEPGDLYRMFCLNCGAFPTNHTAYRRAVAYALDKQAVVQASTGGLAFLQDSALPIALGNWTYEGELTETYYTQDIASANATLEWGGFRDLNGDGWRDFDHNNDSVWDAGLDIDSADFATNLYHTAGHAPSGNAVELAVAGLTLCGIRATVDPQDFTEMLDKITAGDFYLACFTFTNVNTADFLYDYFHSESGNNEWYFGTFNNTAVDAATEAMMAAPTLEEANDWAWESQKLLWFEQPMIVCYNDVYTHAYRTDRWEGYINMAGRNRIGNGYTGVHIKLKASEGGPWGCIPTEYIQSMNEGMDTPNVIMSSEGYAAMVWQLTYSGLTALSPYDWTYQPDLAYNWTTTPTTAGGDIQDGEKYTFYLYANATWANGDDVTATDVINSVYAARQDPREFDNHKNIYKMVAVNSKTVEIYTNKTGYFEWTRATGMTIVPDAVWTAVNVTGFVPTVEQAYGSGPFKWTAWVPGQYVILENNPLWHFAVPRPDDRTACPPPPLDPLLIIGIGVVVVVIIIIAGVYFFRIRK